MKIKKLIVVLFFFVSCGVIQVPSSFKSEKKEINLSSYRELDQADFVDHLASFESVYIEEYANKLQRLSSYNEVYLAGLVTKITESNELFFKKKIKPKFYIVSSKTPYHFSLPGNIFFFSSSLIEKYIKNESILICLITYELIRSEKNIYKKSIIIPTGSMSTNKILSLLRLETRDKVEIHKWAFYLLKRMGLDVDSYLSWLQIKNRNSLDFALQLGDIQSISREEALYKAFLIQNSERIDNFKKYQGSSRKFYNFINKIKR